jgi:hypothetical protein
MMSAMGMFRQLIGHRGLRMSGGVFGMQSSSPQSRHLFRFCSQWLASWNKLLQLEVLE